MAYVITADEYLEISGYPLATPAIRLLDLSPLWSIEYRRTSVPMPYVSGRVPYPTRYEEVAYSLPGKVFGFTTSEGAATSGYRAGLTANLDELRAEVLAEVATGDGTRPAIWHRGDGLTRVADVQVVGFSTRAAQVATELDFSLEITVPAGVWAAP